MRRHGAWWMGLALGVALMGGPARAQEATASFQQTPDGRIHITFVNTAPLGVTPEPHDLKLVLAGRVTIDLTALHHLSGLEKTRRLMERGDTVLLLRGNQGTITASTADGQLVLAPEHPAPAPAHRAVADRASGHHASERRLAKHDKKRNASRTHEADSDAPSSAELEALRKSIAGKLALLNGDGSANTDKTSGDQGQAGNESGGEGGGSSGAPSADNASGGASFATTPSGPAGGAPLAPGPSLPPCKEQPFGTWQGAGRYKDTAVGLRERLARAPDSLSALAALAEFYVSHGLPQEALALLAGWVDDDPAAKQRDRLLRVRDIADLMMRHPVGSNSSLLTPPPDCALPTGPIWKALQAAAIGDRAGIAANARDARAALEDVPEPMRTIFALGIANAAHDDPDTLRLMAAALRDSEGGTMTDVNGRWLLLAEEAAAEHNSVDEELYLQHAAENVYNVPGLMATVRLAGLQIRRPNRAGIEADKRLQDVARTYRHDSVGQEAALILARQRLASGDFAAAFALADSSAQADQNPGESAAARYCAHLLRLLLVDSHGTPLPPAAQRMALFWRYGGYATPGQHGDDIRIGAVTLLLKQNFADAALDVARQLSPATLDNPDSRLLRARAEALAPTGDANAAIAMAHSLAPSNESHLVIATALARLGRLKDAAQAAASVDETAGRQMRADDLYQASDWSGAASAYADVLRDPDLGQAARTEATRRYALCVTLARQTPSDAPAKDLMVADQLSDRLQSIGLPDTQAEPPVTELRTALKRAKKIETILNP